MGKAPIAVIGSGSWGSSLAISLARNGHPVRIWGPELEIMAEIQASHTNQLYLPTIIFPELVTSAQSFQEALSGVDTVLMVVPSHVFRSCLVEFKSYFSPNLRLVWGTKGLDPNTDQFMHEIARDVLGSQVPLAVLSGPSFAMEVARDLPTAVNLAATDPHFADELKTYLHRDRFQVVVLNDMIGMQLSGAMKNVIAIATGLAEGLGYGANTQAALIALGLEEMQALGVKLGADPQTFSQLAGIGDLVLTCSDNQSRNRRFGYALGQGQSAENAMKTIGQVVEGVHNAKQVHRLAKKYHCELTICSTVYDLIFEGLTLEEALPHLFHFA